jgi:hypothetical protein
VFIAFGRFPNQSFVASAHPSTLAIRIVQECLDIGVIVIQVPKDDRGRLHDQLAWLIIASDFDTVH